MKAKTKQAAKKAKGEQAKKSGNKMTKKGAKAHIADTKAKQAKQRETMKKMYKRTK